MFIKSGGNPLVHAIEKLKITTTVAQLSDTPWVYYPRKAAA